MFTVKAVSTNKTSRTDSFSTPHEAKSCAGKTANSPLCKSVTVTNERNGQIIFRVVRGKPSARINVPSEEVDWL